QPNGGRRRYRRLIGPRASPGRVFAPHAVFAVPRSTASCPPRRVRGNVIWRRSRRRPHRTQSSGGALSAVLFRRHTDSLNVYGDRSGGTRVARVGRQIRRRGDELRGFKGRGARTFRAPTTET